MMSKKSKISARIFGTLAVVAALLAAPSAFAQDVVVFGDSLSDPGNHYELTGEVSRAPYLPIPTAAYTIGGHHFTNGNTWIEQLAPQLGAASDVGPATRNGRGSNYAVGRARAAAGGLVPGLHDQLGMYLSDAGGVANSDALYVIWIGSNDVQDALEAYYVDPTGATTNAILQRAVEAIANGIGALAQSGARRFLVANVPNLGVIPVIRALGPQAQYGATLASAGFNAGLEQALSALEAGFGLDITRIDTFSAINGVVAAPASFGVADAVTPCLSFFVVDGAVCEAPEDHFFWDGLHPSALGHGIIADVAAAALELP